MSRPTELRFGVEIECFGTLTREEVAETVRSVTGGQATVSRPTNAPVEKRYVLIDADSGEWKVEPDSSLNADPEFQVEVVTPPLRESELGLLLDVVEGLANAGLKVDGSCGLHVHVDGSLFDVEALNSLIVQTRGAETAIRLLLGLDPDRLERYARTIDEEFFRKVLQNPPEDMEELKSLYYGDDYEEEMEHARRHPARYRGLNLNSYWYRGSIEFRYFPGSLDSEEVKSFVMVCLELAKNALPTRS